MTTIDEVLRLAVEHHQAGRLADAEHLYRQILTVDASQPDPWHLLGVLAHQSGKFDMAVESIGRAIGLKPQESTFHNHLGNVLRDQRRLDEAVACYRRAIQLTPEYAEAHYHLGLALAERGQIDEAAACYRRALELRPESAPAHNALGNALKNQGRLDDAIALYRASLKLNPDYGPALNNLGNALLELGMFDEAGGCYRHALEVNPHYALAHGNLGNVFKSQGKLDDAIACYRRALELMPDNAPAHNNLGNVYKDQGRLVEARACYRRAVELQPGFAAADSNLVYSLYLSPDYDARTLLDEHRRWNRQHAEPLAKFIQPHAIDRSADRRLRIGYVSPDFRSGSTGLFMLPLLESHDHQRYEVFGYSSMRTFDAVTERCRACSDVWRHVAGLSDEQLAGAIRHDKIDVLVDLSMHSANNRLLTFARRPAPVQVTYLAYAGTTGMDAIDYRLTDPFLDPPGQDASIYSEASIRLPRTFWCYRPLAETPAVNPSPAQQVGHVTFGCLNNFCKLTAPALAAWIGLLHAVAESRLLLHAHQGSHRDRVRTLFAEHGIPPERLAFADKVPLAEYFGLFHHIDIALDPFPYGGGTTTCDALWMGVPVVSLAGQTTVGRAGKSILSNVGLAEFVARDPEDYVRIAAELAHDRTRLAELRATLRTRMEHSPLMDAPRFARDVEDAYRAMWRQWCDHERQ